MNTTFRVMMSLVERNFRKLNGELNDDVENIKEGYNYFEVTMKGEGHIGDRTFRIEEK